MYQSYVRKLKSSCFFSWTNTIQRKIFEGLNFRNFWRFRWNNFANSLNAHTAHRVSKIFIQIFSWIHEIKGPQKNLALCGSMQQPCLYNIYKKATRFLQQPVATEGIQL